MISPAVCLDQRALVHFYPAVSLTIGGYHNLAFSFAYLDSFYLDQLETFCLTDFRRIALIPIHGDAGLVLGPVGTDIRCKLIRAVFQPFYCLGGRRIKRDTVILGQAVLAAVAHRVDIGGTFVIPAGLPFRYIGRHRNFLKGFRQRIGYPNVAYHSCTIVQCCP